MQTGQCSLLTGAELGEGRAQHAGGSGHRLGLPGTPFRARLFLHWQSPWDGLPAGRARTEGLAASRPGLVSVTPHSHQAGRTGKPMPRDGFKQRFKR